MKDRFTDVQDIILWLLEGNPGISGADLASSAAEIYQRENPDAERAQEEEVYSILDFTLEDGGIFFDDAEDAWYITGEQPNNGTQVQTETGDIMKITKRQLRNIIKESCALETDDASHTVQGVEAAADHYSAEVPVPEDYDKARDFLSQNPDVLDLGISMVMDAADTGCERSTAQGIIDHLQDMLAPSTHAYMPGGMPPLPSSSMEMIKGPGFTV